MEVRRRVRQWRHDGSARAAPRRVLGRVPPEDLPGRPRREDRKDLLADISRKISATGTNIKSGEFSSEDGMVRVRMLVEVQNLRQLNELMHAVRGIKHVHDVSREEHD